MARPELGTKRQCQSCAAKFYDLGKSPIVCPKCEAVFQGAAQPRASRPEPEDEVDVAAAPEVELAPLEAADGDAAKAEAPETDAEEEDATEADDTFLEEDEEDGDDVTGLIDGEIEDDEEA